MPMKPTTLDDVLGVVRRIQNYQVYLDSRISGVAAAQIDYFTQEMDMAKTTQELVDGLVAAAAAADVRAVKIEAAGASVKSTVEGLKAALEGAKSALQDALKNIGLSDADRAKAEGAEATLDAAGAKVDAALSAIGTVLTQNAA